MDGFKIETETLSRFEDFWSGRTSSCRIDPSRSCATALMHSLKELPDGRWTWKQDHRAGAVQRKQPLEELMARIAENHRPDLADARRAKQRTCSGCGRTHDLRRCLMAN